jgi:hypothetical protein
LGKYHKILLYELKHDSAKNYHMISEKVLKDHRNKLIQAREEEEKPQDTLAEVLLSLRIHALQIPPEQRRNFLASLVKADILNIT